MVYQADASRHGRLRERGRDARLQRRARSAAAVTFALMRPVERLELAGVEERVRFDGPVWLAREVRDEARARCPKHVAAERVRCMKARKHNKRRAMVTLE